MKNQTSPLSLHLNSLSKACRVVFDAVSPPPPPPKKKQPLKNDGRWWLPDYQLCTTAKQTPSYPVCSDVRTGKSIITGSFIQIVHNPSCLVTALTYCATLKLAQAE